MTDVLTTSTPRYILMDAPGYYGDYAQVYASYATLDDARAALRRRKDRKSIVIRSDGGYPQTHQPGSLIHRQALAGYTIYAA